ncbi:MAG: ABC transporter ATP-binding protein [Sulfuritalea sp.]|nr:ABC transporter ATP-binding protein [Sulfuritalea sp.]
MSSAISISGLGKTYPRSWSSPAFDAVRNLSLEICEGEVFGFIGANGAGKSTTIKMLTGVLQPSVGHAKMFGVDVRDHAARKGLGYVPENPSLYDHLTPLEFLLMGLSLHRVNLNNGEAHCRQWLDRFSLAGAANKHIRSFSKGMQQRVALAHAMAIQPRLLILDEPLSGLDPVGRKDVVDILEEFRNSGGTVFLTSHVLHDIERLADRFGLIHHGQLMTVQSPADLLQDEQTLTVRSAGIQSVPGCVAETQGRWRIDVRRDEVWPVLDALRKAQHTILEIRPTMTLEGVFLRYLGASTELRETATSPAREG